MKNLVFAFALLCSTSLVAQFSYNANGTGIQSSNSIASGDFSTAIGPNSLASGLGSTTLGVQTTASGFISTAIGDNTTASGNASTAMGWGTNAKDHSSTVIGVFNKTDETPNPENFSYQNTAFVIGNGGFDSNGGYLGTDESRSNAFEVLFDGSTTISGNVTAPAFIGDGSQLTNMPLSFNAAGSNGIESATNTASGEYSTAMGNGTIAGAPNSSAMGYATTASGEASTAMGYNTEASGGASTAMGRVTIASGNWSTAMGNGTEASGSASTAMGANTTASGNYSTAMGQITTASGWASTAMGERSIASGTLSIAAGGLTTAEDFLSFAIGVHNKTDETPNPDSFSYQNTAFVIGNGGYDSEGNYDGHLSNAFEVLFDGTTTIAGNVTAPAFIGDGSQLTNIPFKYNSEGSQGIQSPTNTASGDVSTAMGYNTVASGPISIAMGYFTTTSGDISTAMGDNSEASGHFSTAMGRSTIASGETATASGQFTTASGKFSLSAGLYSNASGTTSVALGNNTIADGYGTLATGYFNTPNSNPQADTFTPTNTAFVIGNGTFENRSNAFEVLFDGSTTIAGDLNINSDARLKANIISLGATLSKLLQIDGKTYTMKKDANHKKKIGLLAQDIEKVFPELVTETNDIKSVNYQGLVPVLINAMKEQDEVIRSQYKQLYNQDAINKKQQQEIDELKAMVMALTKG